MQEAIGVASNGILFKTAVNGNGYDQIFPRVASGEKIQRVSMDQCLGTTIRTNDPTLDILGIEDTDGDGVYHYTTFSPCIQDDRVVDLVFKCETDPTCKISPVDYAIMNHTSVEKRMAVIGLAKDGRLIYGPYKTGAETWDHCDVDVCNGRMMGNYYGYVATDFFPYLVGCWGPGSQVESSVVFASCSNYPR